MNLGAVFRRFLCWNPPVTQPCSPVVTAVLGRFNLMLHMLIIEETLTPLSVFICHLVRGLRVGNSGPSYFLSFSSVKTPSRKWALKGMQADKETVQNR